MSIGDELAGASLNVGEKAAGAAIDLTVKTIDIIGKLLQYLFEKKRENNRLENEKKITDMKLKAEYGISSSDMTGIKSGEVSANKLVKNAKETFNSIVPIKDGINELDKKFITSKAKEYGIPVAFNDVNGMNYAMLRECDTKVYQQICTELIENKIAKPDKAYHNFLCQKWEMPFISTELNRFNLGAQFGTTKDGRTFCIYRKEDEQAVRIAHGEYLRKHNEVVKDIKIDGNTISDKNGHTVVYNKGDTHSTLLNDIQKTFNFDNTKAEMLCARFGAEQLEGEERKEFFADNIQKQFSKIQNNIHVKGEDVLCTPYTCLRVKPKTDEITRLAFMDKSGNYAVLRPEKQSNRSMKKILREELNITDKATLNALIAKCRSVANFYNAEEAVHKSYSREFTQSDFTPEQMKNLRRLDDDGNIISRSLPVGNIKNTIVRTGPGDFTLKSVASYDEKDANGNDISTSNTQSLEISFSDKPTALEEIKAVYINQGVSETVASEMAEIVYSKAESQNAEQIVEIEQVRAEKFFDSDIPRSATAEMDVTFGGKSATVNLSDTEKAKKEVMNTFGVDEETAEAAIDSGTTDMTFNQESKLIEFGFDTENLTRRDADYLLDKISKNHWELPEDIKPSEYIPFAERTDNKVDTNINFNKNTSSASSGGIGGR